MISLGTAFLPNHRGLAQYKDLPFIWGKRHFAPPGSCRISAAGGQGTMYLEKIAGVF